MPAPQVTFTPSATATYRVDRAGTFTLPAVDVSNPVVVLKNNGTVAVALAAGTTGAAINGIGAITLQPGQQVMTSTAGLIGGTQMAAVADGVGSVMFMRGATTDIWLFAAPGVAVI